MVKPIVTLFVLLIIAFTTVAQELPEETPVEVEATDAYILKGGFYSQPEPSIGILLLHMNGSDRSGWSPIIPHLLDAGYSVLAIDIRGFGKTGGVRSFGQAQTDVQTWLDWLKSQENISGIAIMGASVGGGLGLIGCANDPDCLGVVALSPGEDFFGIVPADAVENGLTDRPMLLVASHGDTDSADAVRAFAQIATGVFTLQMYDRSQHGTGYFIGLGAEEKITFLVQWLTDNIVVPEEE